jgi:hypothetical protein
MVQIAHERYDFDKRKTRFEMDVTLTILNSDSVQQLPNGKYHKSEEFDDVIGRMLDIINTEPPKGYFEEREGLKKFWQEFKERYSK